MPTPNPFANAPLAPLEDPTDADTRILEPPPDIPAPSSQAPYDFEGHGVPSETDLHEADILPEEGEATQVFDPLASARADADRVMAESTGRLKAAAKAQAKRRLTDAEARAQAVAAEGGGHPDFTNAPDTESELAQMAGGKKMSKATAAPEAEIKPVKSIDQLASEDAERILGHPPIKPPVAGTMEGKPVQPTTIKVPDTAMGQPEVKAASRSMVAEDLFPKATPAAPASPRAMVLGDLAQAEKTLGTKAAESLGSAAIKGGQFAKTLGKSIGGELISPFTGAAKGWSKGGNIATKTLRGGWGLGKGLAKGAFEGLVLPAVIAGEGNVISDELTYGADDTMGDPNRNPGLAGARETQIQNLKDYNRSVNKYGLKVTGRTNPLAMLLGGGTNIQVKEDPALKAAYQRKNKQRIQEILEQQTVNPNVRSNQ